MRRILLSVLLLSSIQSFGIVRLGIQGGIASSNISSDPAISTNARGGMALGAALELGLGGDWNIQFEGNYLQRGYVIPATAALPESTVRLDYFQIPVLFKYSFDLLILKPFFVAGPYLGLKMKSDYVQGNTTTELTNIKSSDLGLTFGAGVELAFSPVTSLFASVRYDLGLSNVVDTTGSSVKNKGLLILGGFLFGI